MKEKRFQIFVFAVYCVLMLWLLFGRTGYDPALPYLDQLRFNLRPFRTIALYGRLLDSANPALLRLAVVNLVGNVVMFVPLGYYLALFRPGKSKLLPVLRTAAGIVALVEICQLFTLLGSCDIDDLILNLCGAAMGWWLHRLTK